MCKGRAFAVRELLVFTAAIISLYDIEPAPGNSWDKVKTYSAPGTKHPLKPVKAWIRRRQVPKEE